VQSPFLSALALALLRLSDLCLLIYIVKSILKAWSGALPSRLT
jgi:hypothetical protein